MTDDGLVEIGRVPPVSPGDAPQAMGGEPGGEPFAPRDRGGGLDQEEGIDWNRYLAAVLRRKWLILAVTAVGTAGGLVVAGSVPPLYRAQATLWIEGANQPAQPGGPIQSGHLLDSHAWVELLHTFEVLEHVVRVRGLNLGPVRPEDARFLRSLSVKEGFRPGRYRLVVDELGQAFTLRDEADSVLQRGVPGDSVGAALGMRWVPPADVFEPGRSVEFIVWRLRDAAAALGARLTARIDRNSNFMRIELSGRNPFLVAATLNALADSYVSFAADLKRDRLSELTRILSGQLETAARNLVDSETALAQFQVNNITLPNDQDDRGTRSSPALRDFFSMRAELEALRRDREALQRVLDRTAEVGMPVEAIEAIPSARNSSQVAQLLALLVEKRAQREALRTRYTDDFRSVERLTQEIADLETRSIPSAIRAVLAEMDRREVSLEARVGSASRDLERIPPRSIEEARLRRAVVVAEGLYNVLQQRLATARLAEVSSVPDIRILDRATPPRSPVRNRGPRIVLMALVGSLGLAIAGAILLDLLDPRVRFPSQVVNRLGLSVLGTVPRANGGDIHGTIEAFRAIRLNLVHAHGGRGPLLLTITSPSSAEGKSFVAANLALAFAQAGHRTLLIDGDNRRGGLHRLFDLERKPGLMDVLKGRVDREAVVQQTAFDRLSFVGCGIRIQDGPELLDSPAMAELLGVFRSSYGVILFDSPPLGGGVDAFALATLTGNMVVVLRTGVSKQELAEVKLDILNGLPIRILGAVLNDVSAGGESGRYRRYYSYHLPGYEAEDEEEQLSERRPQRRLLKSNERS